MAEPRPTDPKVRVCVLTREVPKGSPEKVAAAPAELLEEGRKAGLTHFTEVEMTERPMGNRRGGPPVYHFLVYGWE